jgi:hypothetical protein
MAQGATAVEDAPPSTPRRERRVGEHRRQRTVHAATALHASIVGSGDVFYRGAAALHVSSIGSGRVRPI